MPSQKLTSTSTTPHLCSSCLPLHPDKPWSFHLEDSSGLCFKWVQLLQPASFAALRAPAALQADVLHLDITPLNVMLARDRTAKVPYGSFARLEATTRGRTYSCPFPWASPEMLLATGCSKASDVFSFGEHFPG